MGIDSVLARLKVFREARGLSAAELERNLILGPGWISAFESGAIVPALDVLLAILSELSIGLNDLATEFDPAGDQVKLRRKLYAVQDNADLLVHFDYADYQARYRLPQGRIADFDSLLLGLRDGLAQPAVIPGIDDLAVKRTAVTNSFLHAANLWPTANPSDLWWFVIYRAYCDPFNHPATESLRDFGQSWRRTGGWALEEVLVRHYGPWLATQNVKLFIPPAAQKQELCAQLLVAERIEPAKADVILATTVRGALRCFGVVHVKSSFAERRTDDVPMSRALIEAGYTSPLWTMDCKSQPSATPVNHGELGVVLSADIDRRSAKRKDIEDDGYFSGCFSYNQNTLGTPVNQNARAHVTVCDFQNPNDHFSQFLVAEARRFEIRCQNG